MEGNYNFDEIRSFYDSEIQSALEYLISDAEFIKLVQKLIPSISHGILAKQFEGISSKFEFQKKVILPFLTEMEREHSDGITFSGLDKLDKSKAYLFISNHRDIILDSAFLNYILLCNNSDTTEIAIGDNLLIKDWIKIFVRINKSFIIQRNVPTHQLMPSLLRQSAYIHYTITEQKQSIWIAQSEGRAKDSNDLTQESLLKMFTLGRDGNFIDNVMQLNICPISISYEYDPCDYLKAKEFQQKRDEPEYKKTPKDDLQNMYQGLVGNKGRIHFHFCGEINSDLQKISGTRNEQIAKTASLINKRIHANYRIFPNNQVAYDLLLNVKKYATTYSSNQKSTFENYLRQQIKAIDLPQKDVAFVQKKLLEMYANILINNEKAKL